MKEISERLKKVRGNRSQAEFAGFIGMTQQAWQRYESLNSEMSYEQLRGFCVACGVSADWVLGVGGSPPSEEVPSSARCRECARLRALVERQASALADAAEALARCLRGAGKEVKQTRGE